MKTFKLLFPLSLLLCFSLALMVSCKSMKPAEPVVVETLKTITETVRDTVFRTKADSSYYFAYVECVNGKPVLRVPEPMIDPTAPKSKPGKTLETPKVKLTGNQLEVNCEQKAQDLFFQWKEKFTSEQKPVIVKVPEYIEKKLNWYQKALMWIGGIFLILTAIGISLKFIKP